jgi:uncharacterized protein YbjT (DUF2867 family)
MIVVTGAAGRTGRAVVRQLVRDGREVRAYIDPARHAGPLTEWTRRVTSGALADAAALGKALHGADALILIVPADPEQLAQQDAALDIAAAARVPRIVKLSVIGASPTAASDAARWHWRAEQHMGRLDASCCIVRAGRYLQTIAQQVPMLLSAGVLAGCQGDGRAADVDARDVAAVVAAAVDPARVPDGMVEVTGGEAVDYPTVAARLSIHLGRPIRYVDCPPARLIESLRASGLSDWQARERAIYEVLARRGRWATVLDTVARITLAPPRTLDGYLHELAHGLRYSHAPLPVVPVTA